MDTVDTNKASGSVVPTPSGLKIAGITRKGIEFQWKPIPTASGYELYRGYSSEGPFKRVFFAKRGEIGAYWDRSFDREVKSVFYTLRSYVLDEEGKKTYSGMAEPVEARFMENLSMSRETTYLYDGTTRRLRVYYGWGEPADGVWSSTDESVAVVDQNGIITGVSGGVCDILYTGDDGQAISHVVVNRSPEEMLRLQPARFQRNTETGDWENPDAEDTGTAVLMLAGDLMCGKAQMQVQNTPEQSWDFTDSFEFARRILKDSDFAMGSMKTLLAPGWPYMCDETCIQDTMNYNAPPRYLEAVRYGGFDALAMANNHNCDGGVRALLETIDQTDRYQFAHTGIFRDAEEERFFIAKVNGIRVGFLAYTTRRIGFNDRDRGWSARQKAAHLHVFSPARAAADIAACRARGAEYVIVYMHWGQNSFRKPSVPQLRSAQRVADAGADYIVGTNSCWPQAYDLLTSADGRRVPCVYSLGNFQAAMHQIPAHRNSVLLRLRLNRDKVGRVVLAENHYIPFHIYRSLDGARWAPVAVSEDMNPWVKKADRARFYDDITARIGPDMEVLNRKEVSLRAPGEKTIPPHRRTIRRIMTATGWGAYETYCNLAYIAWEKGASYQQILDENLWSVFLREAALASLGKLPAADFSGLGLMDREEFEEHYFTARQKRCIQAISEGRLTARILFEYMRLRPPLIPGFDLDADVTDRLALTLTDVRPGCIFLCIRKNDIVPESILRRKPACIISYYENYQPLFGDLDIPYLSSPYMYSYILDLAELWKKHFPIKTVAVSGSVGKTTTTEMIAQVLGAAYQVYKRTGNQNTTSQIAQSVFRMKEDYEVFVQECSGSTIGQLSNSGRVLHPDCFVLTNIGNSHLAHFQGKKELLSYEKTSLDRNAAPGAVGVINWDNRFLRDTRYRHPMIRISLSNPGADIISDNVEEQHGMVAFDVVERNAGDRRTRVQLQLFGDHNIYNALSAFAVGVQMGVPRDVIAQALASYRPKGVRQSLVSLNGQNVFIDCYNASLESITATVTAMRSIQCEAGKKKIAVLGDVLELGEDSERLHREIGRAVADIGSVDEVLFYGPEMRCAMEEASGKISCRHTEDREELLSMIREAAPTTGLILFKASHGMAFQRVIDDLYGSDYYAMDESTRHAPVESVGNGQYRCIPDYGCVFKKRQKVGKHAEFADAVNGLPVRAMDKGALEGSRLHSVKLPSRLECISENAFHGCEYLREVEFPETLKCIRAGAFRDCVSLEILDLSRGCGTIEAEAFAGCSNLRAVFLPDSLLTISDAAFNANTLAVFCCHSGSYAESWARRNHYRVITM